MRFIWYHCYCLSLPLLQTEQFIVLWFLLLSIVVGNLAVLAALRLSKARKSRTNFFIMHLALAGQFPVSVVLRVEIDE